MSATMQFASERIELPDALAVIEYYFEQGWTDGLPIVPPTAEAVAAFLTTTSSRPDDIVGYVPNRNITVTAEKVAINAVMAGCRPEYFPVVLTATQALTDDRFNLHGSMASTAGAAPLVIVNGPVAAQIGVNAGDNVFGPGWRANATIGRTLRLVLMNVCRAQPGVMDKATLGHPGKYTYCIGELESESAWEPLHVERGAARDQSAVTVFAAEAPHYVRNDSANSAEAIANSMIDVLSRATNRGGCCVIVVCPEHLQVFLRDGWSKRDLRTYLAERTVRSLADLKRCGWVPGAVRPADEQNMQRWYGSPDQVLVVVAGGKTSGSSAVVPPWAGGMSSQPVTKGVSDCLDSRG
ncbi:MAG: hypothetical protein IT307_13760 [Chloroflexi bacterium]|nr:hypothetical protein [Chloroflexota bacterium]